MEENKTPNKPKVFERTKDKVLGGVLGGIAKYFDLDTTLIRIIGVLLILNTEWALMAYIAAWLIAPEEA